MEENITVPTEVVPVVVAPIAEEIMNPSTNAPIYYGPSNNGVDSALLAGLATKDYYNPVDSVTAGGVCDLREAVGNTKYVVKDAEANIRFDIAKSESEIRRDVAKTEADIRAEILKEGQDNLKATMSAECSLSKEILETRHTLAKDILKSEYENKLAIQTAIKEINTEARHNAERTQDKIDHGFEEVNEKLCECCGEAALAAANTQNGLVTIQNLLNGLVGGTGFSGK